MVTLLSYPDKECSLLPATTLVSNHHGTDKRQQTDIQEPMHMILEQLNKNTELLTVVITQIDSQETEIAIIKEKLQSFESSCFTGQKNLKSVKKAKEVTKAVSVSCKISLLLIIYILLCPK